MFHIKIALKFLAKCSKFTMLTLNTFLFPGIGQSSGSCRDRNSQTRYGCDLRPRCPVYWSQVRRNASWIPPWKLSQETMLASTSRTCLSRTSNVATLLEIPKLIHQKEAKAFTAQVGVLNYRFIFRGQNEPKLNWGHSIIFQGRILYFWYLSHIKYLNEPTFSRAIWVLGLHILWALAKFWRQLARGPALFRHLLILREFAKTDTGCFIKEENFAEISRKQEMHPSLKRHA